MISLPIQYLHLETGIFPVFLVMVFLTQLARANEPGYYVQSGRTHMLWLSAGFVFFSLVFGALLYKVSPLLAVELAAGFTISMLHPANALCLFVHLLFLRPWEIVTDNALLSALPRLVGALCVFSWLIHPGQHAKPTGRTSGVLVVLLGFSIWLFLSTFVTPQIAETQADWFATYFKSPIVFVMCLFFIESERSVKEFEMTLVISVLAMMTVGFYQFFIEGASSARLESVGMFGNSNDLASVIVMVIPFALVPAFSAASSLVPQAVGILFSGFSLLLIWFTRSRGAMLALAAQALTAMNFGGSSKRWLGTMLLAGLLGAGYFTAIKVMPRDAEDMEISSESRITFWKTAVNMTLHNPIFGVGFDEFPANYDSYSTGVKYVWGLRTAHSSWFLAFAESGVIGGLLFVTFFLMVLRTAWRNRQRWPAQFYALAGYGVAMSFLSHTYTFYFYLLAGLVIASDAFQEGLNCEQDIS